LFLLLQFFFRSEVLGANLWDLEQECEIPSQNQYWAGRLRISNDMTLQKKKEYIYINHSEVKPDLNTKSALANLKV
jgi:hypothetical protein